MLGRIIVCTSYTFLCLKIEVSRRWARNACVSGIQIWQIARAQCNVLVSITIILILDGRNRLISSYPVSGQQVALIQNRWCVWNSISIRIYIIRDSLISGQGIFRQIIHRLIVWDIRIRIQSILQLSNPCADILKCILQWILLIWWSLLTCPSRLVQRNWSQWKKVRNLLSLSCDQALQ